MKREHALTAIGVLSASLALLLYYTMPYRPIVSNQGSAGDHTHESAEESVALVEIDMPASLEGAAAEGQAIFRDNCASCHGQNGEGVETSGPPLIHRYYEPGHHSDAAFQLAVQQGVRQHHWKFGNMAPVEGVSRDQVTKIVSFIRAVQRENGIE